MTDLELTVADRSGSASCRPVTGGVPLAPGAAPRGSRFVLRDANGSAIPLQTRKLADWPDGSARWLLLDFQAAPPANGRAAFTLSRTDAREQPALAEPVRCRRGASPRLRSGGVSVTVTDSGVLDISGRVQVALSMRAASGAQCRAVIERIDVTTAGPLRSTLAMQGAMYHRAGDRIFGFELRVSVYAGLSLVRLEPGILVDAGHGVLQRVRELGLDLRLPPPFTNLQLGGMSRPPALAARLPMRLLQVDDQNWTLEGTRNRGKQAPGWAELGNHDGSLAVCLRDFWQQWPKALEVRHDGLSIGLLPRFRRGQFGHMTPWYKHDYLFKGACYQLRTGQARRWDVWLDLNGDGAALAAACRQPLVPVLEPVQAIATGVWGDIGAAGTPGMDGFDGVEGTMVRHYLDAIREARDYGAMNWGDWFGERHCNWGNHEYDTVNQLLLRFARTGDIEAFHAANVAARHSSEVDVVHHVNPELETWFRSTTVADVYDTYPARPGMMHEHAVGHVGGFHTIERIRRLFVSFGTGRRSRPYLCLDPYNLGHMFCHGMVRQYFLTGDPWLRRTAEVIGENLVALVLDGHYPHFEGGSHSGRVNGWTMLALAAVYELRRAPRVRRAMRRLADLTLAAQDSNSGGWLYELPWGHCFCRTRQHVGEAGFITGVRLNGLVRYHQLTGDSRIPDAVCRAVTNMIRDLWMEREAGWRYTSCPASAGPVRHGVQLAAVASAWRLGGDPEHLRVLRRCWASHLEHIADEIRNKPDAGKTYSARIYGCAEVASTVAAAAR